MNRAFIDQLQNVYKQLSNVAEPEDLYWTPLGFIAVKRTMPSQQVDKAKAQAKPVPRNRHERRKFKRAGKV